MKQYNLCLENTAHLMQEECTTYKIPLHHLYYEVHHLCEQYLLTEQQLTSLGKPKSLGASEKNWGQPSYT